MIACEIMIYRLNIEEGRDYYVVNGVRRMGADHRVVPFKRLRYVNTFLHASIRPESRGRVRSAISGRMIPAPRTKTKPKPAPPPLKENHIGYNNAEIDKYFGKLLKVPNVYNLKTAVYTNPVPERVEEKMAMRCMSHTYSGELGQVQDLDGVLNYLQGLAAGSPNKNPYIVGFLGHGLTSKLRLRHKIQIEVKGKMRERKAVVTVTSLQGRVIIGNQQILEDLSTDAIIVPEVKDKMKNTFLQDPLIKKLIKKGEMREEDVEVTDEQVAEGINSIALKANQVLLSDPQIQNNLQILGTSLSPLAVIVLYHCHNGRRQKFLQTLANLVKRPVFAYTGFLGWWHNYVGKDMTIANINNNWAQVRDRLVTQEFNYQKEKGTGNQGDWVVATPVIASVTPATLSVRIGQAATFNVTVSEDTKPSVYQWYEANNPIAKQTAAQLTITKDKAGAYELYCKVTDSLGATADSNVVTLTVTATPH